MKQTAAGYEVRYPAAEPLTVTAATEEEALQKMSRALGQRRAELPSSGSAGHLRVIEEEAPSFGLTGMEPPIPLLQRKDMQIAVIVLGAIAMVGVVLMLFLSGPPPGR